MATGFVDRVKGKSVISTQYQSQGGQFYGSALDSITAAGTTALTATALTNSINRVTTVSSNTGVRLPVAIAGASITVIHAAVTNALTVWPSGTDTINGVTTGYSIAAAAAGVGKVANFYCSSTGIWHALLSS